MTKQKKRLSAASLKRKTTGEMVAITGYYILAHILAFAYQLMAFFFFLAAFLLFLSPVEQYMSLLAGWLLSAVCAYLARICWTAGAIIKEAVR